MDKKKGEIKMSTGYDRIIEVINHADVPESVKCSAIGQINRRYLHVDLLVPVNILPWDIDPKGTTTDVADIIGETLIHCSVEQEKNLLGSIYRALGGTQQVNY